MQLLGRELGTQQTFEWAGMEWSSANLLLHLGLVGVAIGVALVASLLFDRFTSIRGSDQDSESLVERVWRRLAGRWMDRGQPQEGQSGDGSVLSEDQPAGPVSLTPLASRSNQFRFGRALMAELRLTIKGLQWWWFLVAGGLIVASLVVELETAHRWLLPIAWIWPALIWSTMGVREVQNHTDQLVFLAPHPLRRQLPITWLTGLIVTSLAGSGVLIRLLLDANLEGVLTWGVAAVFIPSLALALGTWSGSSKLFQIVYL